MSGITQAATSPSVGSAEELDQLLGGEAPAEEDTATHEEETENSGAETDESTQETQGGEEATEEVEEREAPAEEEETELSIDESERDYSEAAYEKAAAHYARTKKIALDPADSAHRALLKEIMDRGRDFAALKREEAEAGKTTTEEATGKTAEQPPQVPAKPTPEQIQEFTKNAAIVAKARIIPEVAKYVTNRFITALWPSEAEAGELPEVTQEQANDFTAALSEFFWMQLDDALPAILGQSRMSLSADPVFGQVEQQTISATAFERMDGMRDKATGKPLYPDLEEMVESGTLRKVLADKPEIGKLVAGNGRDPVANQLLRYQTAYRRAKKIAAGRVSSGRPSGGFSRGMKSVVSEITGGGGSKFSQALRRDARKA